MPLKIFKYSLERGSCRFTIDLPPGSKVLSVGATAHHAHGVRSDLPCLWAEVEVGADGRPSNPGFTPIYSVGTGRARPPLAGTYLGTVRDSNDEVWHYYLEAQHGAA